MSRKKKTTAMAQKVRSMRKILAEQHGIEVPFTALQAAVLAASGIDPQAPVPGDASIKALALSPEAWGHRVAHWMGEHDVVLHNSAYQMLLELPFIRTPDAPRLQLGETGTKRPREASRIHRPLWIHKDENGQYHQMTLDRDGDFGVSSARVQQIAGTIVGLTAHLSSEDWRVAMHMANLACKDITHMMRTLYGLSVSSASVIDLKEVPNKQAEDYIELRVEVSIDAWNELLAGACSSGNPAMDWVAEWVGLHYRENFEGYMSIERKVYWLDRYLAALEA